VCNLCTLYLFIRALSIHWYRICTRAFPPSMQSSPLLSCSVLRTYNCHYSVYYTDTNTAYILHNYKEIHRECCQSLIEYLHDMAPSKARAGHDDSRSEASSTREKQNAGHTTKGRRAAHGAGNSSSLRDVTTAGSAVAAAAAGASNASNQEANVGVSIHSFTIRHTHGC
jgi:hypothetical protein